MAEINLATPVKLKMVNNTEFVRSFQPYRENFVSALEAKSTLEFEVMDSEEALYYLKHSTEDLTITTISEFDEASVELKITVLPNKAVMTLTNETEESLRSFVPYKQNFQENLEGASSIEIDAEGLGEILYYLGQATDGLVVTYEAKN